MAAERRVGRPVGSRLQHGAGADGDLATSRAERGARDLDRGRDHLCRRHHPGGITFESLPDGVSVYPRGNGRADVFVNHETSTVPFPSTHRSRLAAAGEANQNDFTNSEVSQLTSTSHSMGITSGLEGDRARELPALLLELPRDSVEGFDRDILFTNEEAQDWVFRAAQPGPGRRPSHRRRSEPSKPGRRRATT